MKKKKLSTLIISSVLAFNLTFGIVSESMSGFVATAAESTAKTPLTDYELIELANTSFTVTDPEECIKLEGGYTKDEYFLQAQKDGFTSFYADILWNDYVRRYEEISLKNQFTRYPVIEFEQEGGDFDHAIYNNTTFLGKLEGYEGVILRDCPYPAGALVFTNAEYAAKALAKVQAYGSGMKANLQGIQTLLHIEWDLYDEELAASLKNNTYVYSEEQIEQLAQRYFDVRDIRVNGGSSQKRYFEIALSDGFTEEQAQTLYDDYYVRFRNATSACHNSYLPTVNIYDYGTEDGYLIGTEEFAEYVKTLDGYVGEIPNTSNYTDVSSTTLVFADADYAYAAKVDRLTELESKGIGAELTVVMRSGAMPQPCDFYNKELVATLLGDSYVPGTLMTSELEGYAKKSIAVTDPEFTVTQEGISKYEYLATAIGKGGFTEEQALILWEDYFNRYCEIGPVNTFRANAAIDYLSLTAKQLDFLESCEGYVGTIDKAEYDSVDGTVVYEYPANAVAAYLKLLEENRGDVSRYTRVRCMQTEMAVELDFYNEDLANALKDGTYAPPPLVTVDPELSELAETTSVVTKPIYTIALAGGYTEEQYLAKAVADGYTAEQAQLLWDDYAIRYLNLSPKNTYLAYPRIDYLNLSDDVLDFLTKLDGFEGIIDKPEYASVQGWAVFTDADYAFGALDELRKEFGSVDAKVPMDSVTVMDIYWDFYNQDLIDEFNLPLSVDNSIISLNGKEVEGFLLEDGVFKVTDKDYLMGLYGSYYTRDSYIQSLLNTGVDPEFAETLWNDYYERYWAAERNGEYLVDNTVKFYFNKIADRMTAEELTVALSNFKGFQTINVSSLGAYVATFDNAINASISLPTLRKMYGDIVSDFSLNIRNNISMEDVPFYNPELVSSYNKEVTLILDGKEVRAKTNFQGGLSIIDTNYTADYELYPKRFYIPEAVKYGFSEEEAIALYDKYRATYLEMFDVPVNQFTVMPYLYVTMEKGDTFSDEAIEEISKLNGFDEISGPHTTYNYDTLEEITYYSISFQNPTFAYNALETVRNSDENIVSADISIMSTELGFEIDYYDPELVAEFTDDVTLKLDGLEVDGMLFSSGKVRINSTEYTINYEGYPHEKYIETAMKDGYTQKEAELLWEAYCDNYERTGPYADFLAENWLSVAVNGDVDDVDFSKVAGFVDSSSTYSEQDDLTIYKVTFDSTLAANAAIDTISANKNVVYAVQSVVWESVANSVSFYDAVVVNKIKKGLAFPEYGDFQNDGKVSLSDVVVFGKYLGGKTNFSDYQKVAADVYQDNRVDANDLIALIKFSFGELESLPIKP